MIMMSVRRPIGVALLRTVRSATWVLGIVAILVLIVTNIVSPGAIEPQAHDITTTLLAFVVVPAVILQLELTDATWVRSLVWAGAGALSYITLLIVMATFPEWLPGRTFELGNSIFNTIVFGGLACGLARSRWRLALRAILHGYARVERRARIWLLVRLTVCAAATGALATVLMRAAESGAYSGGLFNTLVTVSTGPALVGLVTLEQLLRPSRKRASVYIVIGLAGVLTLGLVHFGRHGGLPIRWFDLLLSAAASLAIGGGLIRYLIAGYEDRIHNDLEAIHDREDVHR